MSLNHVSTTNLITWWESTHPRHITNDCICVRGGRCGAIESLVDTINLRMSVSRSTVFRRIRSGTLTMDEADRYACALGTMPHLIWPGFDRLAVTASLSGPCGSRNLF